MRRVKVDKPVWLIRHGSDGIYIEEFESHNDSGKNKSITINGDDDYYCRSNQDYFVHEIQRYALVVNPDYIEKAKQELVASIKHFLSEDVEQKKRWLTLAKERERAARF